jgi:hypothetical protein
VKSIFLAFSILFLAGNFADAGPSRIDDLSGWSTNGGVVIRWTAPIPTQGTSLTNVTVKYSTSPINALNWNSGSHQTVSWLSDPGTPGTEQQIVIIDLVADTIYFVAVKTTDSTGSSSTISNLALVRSGNSTYSITIAWDLNEEPDLAGYRLHIGTSSGNYDTSIDTGNVSSYTVSGQLLYGFVYYIALSAYNTAGAESTKSPEISYPGH